MFKCLLTRYSWFDLKASKLNRDAPCVSYGLVVIAGNFPRGRGGFRRDDGVVGRTVKVRMGPFKGYRGRVVDATDSTVRIELESQMKVVTGASDPSVGHQLDSFLLLWMLRLRLTIEIAVACCGFNNLCIMATHNHLMVLVVCS